MDLARVFTNLRPDATFKGNRVNFYSLEKIAETFIGVLPTQAEMDVEWARIQSEDIPKDEIKEQLAVTDKDLPRALEDMYDLLLLKNIIKADDLNDTVKDKLNEKKLLRGQL